MAARAAEVGWIPVPLEDATAKRGGEVGMLFRDDLGSALGAFDPEDRRRPGGDGRS